MAIKRGKGLIITCNAPQGCTWICPADGGCNDNTYICPSFVSSCSLSCNSCHVTDIRSSVGGTTIHCNSGSTCSNMAITAETNTSSINLLCWSTDSCTDITFSCTSDAANNCVCTDGGSNACLNGVYGRYLHADSGHIVFNTKSPTIDPTLSPSNDPTIPPSNYPTLEPTMDPTLEPSNYPTLSPSNYPTISPSNYPSKSPTLEPTYFPTNHPIIESKPPSTSPMTEKPSISPTSTIEPTISPLRTPPVTHSSNTNYAVLVIIIGSLSLFFCSSSICMLFILKRYKNPRHEHDEEAMTANVSDNDILSALSLTGDQKMNAIKLENEDENEDEIKREESDALLSSTCNDDDDDEAMYDPPNKEDIRNSTFAIESDHEQKICR